MASRSPFPLADGNRWVLRNTASGAVRTMSLSRKPSGLVLRGLPGAADLRVRRVGKATEAWDRTSGRWEPLLRLGAPVGTRYVVDIGDSTLWRSVQVKVASRQAVVHDARGKTLRGCVRLAFHARKPVADAGLEELTFAPGIGPVAVTEITIAGPRRSTLASFRLR
jgi:hypothetical protein